ncbi:MAG: hypothetical protein IT427_14510 [Pirellulales bacterium]|nr:hypothetical protein [Pirellulales bacterium]
MEIKTFRAASMPEALRLVRRELGPEAAVLRTREVRCGGLLGLLSGERGIEVEASAEVIVPSRLPKRPAISDQGLDLTELAETCRPIDPEIFTGQGRNCQALPLHLVVAGAASGVGATTVALNLAASLGARQLRTIVWNHENSFDHAGGAEPTNRPADVLLFDAGSKPARRFDRLWDIAGLVLLVVSPESKSILDGYAAIKMLVERRPALRVQTVVNRARDFQEADRIHRPLDQACRQFLNLELRGAGFVSHDDQLSLAMQAGRSVVVDTPHCRAARQFERIASELAIDPPIHYRRSDSRKNLKFAESAVAIGRY